LRYCGFFAMPSGLRVATETASAAFFPHCGTRTVRWDGKPLRRAEALFIWRSVLSVLPYGPRDKNGAVSCLAAVASLYVATLSSVPASE
jgi:hypothetical protein